MNVEARQRPPAPGPGAEKLISALHIGKYFPPFFGGMENFLADLLTALNKSGIRTHTVVHDHRPGLRGSVAATPAVDPFADGTPPSHANSSQLYRAPSLGRLLYSPVSPQFPIWLKRAFRTERPDVLHLHLPNTSAFWALWSPEAREVPWVVHWHADVVASQIDRRLKLAYPLYRQFEQRLLGRAAAIVVSSPPYLDNSQALAPWRHQCRVIPLGLDPSRIPDVSDDAGREAELLWGDAEFRILSVGRLTYYKGYEYLVQAMEGVPGARAVIVGEGERRRSLEKMVSKLNLDKRVILTGRLPSGRLHSLMETCHCVCLPSIERTEAFGLVLLEAMAHRKPTVVCDIHGSGVSWVVQDGETGVVVPPADSAALSKAFRTLATDHETLSRLGQQGWKRYQNMFHIDRVSGEILKLYEEILEARRAA